MFPISFHFYNGIQYWENIANICNLLASLFFLFAEFAMKIYETWRKLENVLVNASPKQGLTTTVRAKKFIAMVMIEPS